MASSPLWVPERLPWNILYVTQVTLTLTPASHQCHQAFGIKRENVNYRGKDRKKGVLESEMMKARQVRELNIVLGPALELLLEAYDGWRWRTGWKEGQIWHMHMLLKVIHPVVCVYPSEWKLWAERMFTLASNRSSATIIFIRYDTGRWRIQTTSSDGGTYGPDVLQFHYFSAYLQLVPISCLMLNNGWKRFRFHLRLSCMTFIKRG